MPYLPASTQCDGHKLTPTGQQRRATLFAGAWLFLLGGLARRSNAAPAEPDRGDRSDRGEPARLAALCSGANPIGVGLRGEYFTTEGCAGRPGAVRIDTSIEFASADQLSSAAGLARLGSVRWTGWIKAHVSGRFRFDGGSPEVRVFVSNIALAGPQAQAAADIPLAAGRYYPIRVELERLASAAAPIRLQWTVPYGAHYVVPRQLLFLPTEVS